MSRTISQIRTLRVLVLLLVLLPLASAAVVPLFGRVRAARRAVVRAPPPRPHRGRRSPSRSIVRALEVTADTAARAGRRFDPSFVPGDPGGKRPGHRTHRGRCSASPRLRPSPVKPGPERPVLPRPRRAEPLAGRARQPHADPGDPRLVGLDEGAARGVLRLAVPAPGRRDRGVPVVRRDPLLRLLRADADPGVLPDRPLGLGSGRRDAARKFFLYTLAGSLLTLVGVIGDRARPTRAPTAGPITFSLPDLMANVQSWA